MGAFATVNRLLCRPELNRRIRVEAKERFSIRSLRMSYSSKPPTGIRKPYPDTPLKKQVSRSGKWAQMSRWKPCSMAIYLWYNACYSRTTVLQDTISPVAYPWCLQPLRRLSFTPAFGRLSASDPLLDRPTVTERVSPRMSSPIKHFFMRNARRFERVH